MPIDQNKKYTIELSNGERYKIGFLDFGLMKGSITLTLFAKRGSGKSWVVRDMLYQLNDRKICDEFVIMSGTEGANKFYDDIVNNCYIYNEFNEKKLEKILNKQKELKAKTPKHLWHTIKKICIVFDDVSGKDKGGLRNSPMFRELFKNGRHYNITTLIATQYVKDFGPGERDNIDFSLFLYNDSKKKVQKLMEVGGDIIGDKFNDFFNAYQELTQDHRVMVICQKQPHGGLSEKVFWFKARTPEELPNYKVGSRQAKIFHEKTFSRQKAVEYDARNFS